MVQNLLRVDVMLKIIRNYINHNTRAEENHLGTIRTLCENNIRRFQVPQEEGLVIKEVTIKSSILNSTEALIQTEDVKTNTDPYQPVGGLEKITTNIINLLLG